jgi:hypothetical protein
VIPGEEVECVNRESWLKSKDFRVGDNSGVWAKLRDC